MKTLILIRHAKASSQEPTLPDLQRPITAKGEINTLSVAKNLADRVLSVDVLYSSPAERAYNTARLLAGSLGVKKKHIIIDPELYTFHSDDLLEWVRHLDKQLDVVALVGHNDAVTDLLNFLALTHLENLPTSGVAILEVDVKKWKNVLSGSAQLQALQLPEKYSSKKPNSADKLDQRYSGC